MKTASGISFVGCVLAVLSIAVPALSRRGGPATSAVEGGGALFVDSGQALGTGNDQGVALGDLDFDGDLDAFVVTFASAAHGVWLNQGGAQGGTPGSFVDSGQQLGTDSGTDVALGDVDGDGDLDAFVTHSSPVADRVWLNDGSGGFADSGQALGLTSSQSLRLADLDADGDLDAVVGALGGTRIWINQGGAQGGDEGEFLDSAQQLAAGLDTLAVGVGDFDGDGDVDVALGLGAGTVGQPDRVFLNDGAALFVDSGQLLGAARTLELAVADLDSDGDLDLYAATGGTGEILGDRVWINQGGAQGGNEGSFVGTGQAIGSDNTRGVALGDYDLDGDLDAFAANFNGADRIWLNDGTGQFIDSGQLLGFDISADVAVGRLDGDLVLDAFVATFGADRVWLGQSGGSGGATGSFLAPDHLDVDSGGFAVDVALGDFDSDGDLDLVVIVPDGGRVWINQGGSQGGTQGAFLDSGQDLDACGAFEANRVELADLDGDGDLDAFLGRSGPDAVFANAGDGTFVFTGLCLGAEKTEDIVLGDVDRDGDLDAATLGTGFDPSRLWFNQGDGTFVASAQTFGVGDSRAGAAAGDFDGDGDLDLVQPSLDSFGVNELWVNQGGAQGGIEGSFLPSGQQFSDSWDALAAADFDGDGDLDVVVSGQPGLRLWANDGSGFFDTDGACRGAGTESPVDVGVADFDGDGTPDLFVAKRPTTVTPDGLRAPMAETWLARPAASGIDLRHTRQCFAYGDESAGGPRTLFGVERIALGDVDGDGAIDAVGANDDGVRIWRNGAPSPATGYQRCCSIEAEILGAGRSCPLPGSTRPTARVRAPERDSAELGLDPAGIDLGTYVALRDGYLPSRAEGGRFVDFYSDWDLEVFLLLAFDGDLRAQGFGALALWQDDLVALVGGTGGGETVSQAEVDAIEGFLLALQAAGSPGLVQALDAELDRLPPFQTFVGLDVEAAATIVAGPPTLVFADGFESGGTGAWSATMP